MKTPIAMLLSAGVFAFTASNVTAAGLDLNCLGNALNGWDYKKGTAAEYKSANSNYRTYKPTVTKEQNGFLYVSTKLDHIRGGGKDDHALVELRFTPYGQLAEARAQMQIQGHNTIDTDIVASGVALINPAVVPAVEIVGSVINSLSAAIDKMGEHGGRTHFPSIVKHNINAISSCTYGGT